MSKNRHAQDLQPYCRSVKRGTTREGVIRFHLTVGEDRPRPHWVPNDSEEFMILKSIREAPHLLTMPFNEATVQHN